MLSRAAEVLSRLEPFGIALGLGRIERLLAARDSVHLRLPTVLVAGTNGKGSTAAWLTAMSRAAGYRTGLFLSPHLEELTERISIDGENVDDATLANLLQDSIDTACSIGIEPPTSFEALTFAALCYFDSHDVDLAILEVGLGGRFDATNICSPQLSIVTSIGLDHQEHLGHDLQSIAAEKAGVARPGKPLIGWGEPAVVRRVLKEKCQEIGAHWIDATTAAQIRIAKLGARRQRFEITTPQATYDLEVHLLGQHQGNNLAQAVLAAEQLARQGWENLDQVAISRGAAECRWPGRLEWVDLPTGQQVLLDSAHNPAGALALASYLSQLDSGIHLLFGALADKEVHDMLPILARYAQHVTLTSPPTPRGGDPSTWRPMTGRSTTVIEDPVQALEVALDGVTPNEVLVVCGSTYLIGDVRRRLRSS